MFPNEILHYLIIDNTVPIPVPTNVTQNETIDMRNKSYAPRDGYGMSGNEVSGGYGGYSGGISGNYGGTSFY